MTYLRVLGAAVLFLAVVVLTNHAEASLSTGIYIDNGFDQTVLEPFVDKYEKEEMEDEMLTLLG